MSLRKYFGTDGIRGVAGEPPLVPEFVFRLGQAACEILEETGGSRKLLIGRDTRASGPDFEAALAKGAHAAGWEVESLGVLPTPAVALAVVQTNAALGAVISASHNPAKDNGIKFFGADGFKLHDDVEQQIEQRLDALPTDEDEDFSAIQSNDQAWRQYSKSMIAAFSDLDLRGWKIALDAANGASFQSSPEVLQRLGANVIAGHVRPDGWNINVDCGSTHPKSIEALVNESGARLGISHDGDADRVLLCDETGSSLDGDELLAIAALHFLKRDRLKHRTLVATVMSNFGLDETLESVGGRVERTAVGDRYVIERMRELGCNVGGEQSGHLIFADTGTTGDGLAAALHFLRVMQETGEPLSQLRLQLKRYPQVLRNLKVHQKPELSAIPCLQDSILEAEKQLDGKGRVLIRYSGTEPKMRILVEGRDAAEIEAMASKMQTIVQNEIGL